MRDPFLLGIPTESSKDIIDSINLIKEIEPDETVLNVYVPIPKTEWYEYIKENFYDLDSIDWTTFSRDEVPFLSYVNNSDKRYEEFFNLMFKVVEEENAKKKL